MKKYWPILLSLVLLTASLIAMELIRHRVGRELDNYRGVAIYENGIDYTASHGLHYAADGYYYGQKWQCIEFVKRFLHDAKGHKMPYVMGHAKEFFDDSIPHRQLNPQRNMNQFMNGGNEPPLPDDLLVFTDSKYGHVAIVSKVDADSVEVVQQNILGKSRQIYHLKIEGGLYTIDSPNAPAGWLRVPPP